MRHFCFPCTEKCVCVLDFVYTSMVSFVCKGVMLLSDFGLVKKDCCFIQRILGLFVEILVIVFVEAMFMK